MSFSGVPKVLCHEVRAADNPVSLGGGSGLMHCRAPGKRAQGNGRAPGLSCVIGRSCVADSALQHAFSILFVVVSMVIRLCTLTLIELPLGSVSCCSRAWQLLVAPFASAALLLK